MLSFTSGRGNGIAPANCNALSGGFASPIGHHLGRSGEDGNIQSRILLPPQPLGRERPLGWLCDLGVTGVQRH